MDKIKVTSIMVKERLRFIKRHTGIGYSDSFFYGMSLEDIYNFLEGDFTRAVFMYENTNRGLK